ncbi:hypothetical protein K1719_040010 [Acacia pycnantha]|nr:hypothetical protein K1719_040010 [Acacia pycnantha]
MHVNLTVEGYSIYIRNLPFSVTASQLEEEFKKFGPIKQGGIQVRNNKKSSFPSQAIPAYTTQKARTTGWAHFAMASSSIRTQASYSTKVEKAWLFIPLKGSDSGSALCCRLQPACVVL